jgi:hypothetical protein
VNRSIETGPVKGKNKGSEKVGREIG